MMPELLHLGQALAHELEQSPQRIDVVISADGAHTHTKVQPCWLQLVATHATLKLQRIMHALLQLSWIQAWQ